MTQEEILQYNKRCAEFLGAIYSDCAEAWGFGNAKNIGSKMFHGVMYHNVIQAERFEKELKFHSDWNWIMEVVEAIEKLGYESLIGGSEYYYPEKGMRYIQCFIKDEINIYQEAKTKKEAVVEAINQFLIWYEQNKTI